MTPWKVLSQNANRPVKCGSGHYGRCTGSAKLMVDSPCSAEPNNEPPLPLHSLKEGITRHPCWCQPSDNVETKAFECTQDTRFGKQGPSFALNPDPLGAWASLN